MLLHIDRQQTKRFIKEDTLHRHIQGLLAQTPNQFFLVTAE